MTVTTRTATQADLDSIGQRLEKTAHVIAIERDGQLAAVAGYYPDEGSVVMFSRIAPWAREVPGFARYMLRFAREIQRQTAQYGVQVAASADPAVPKAENLLRHLGFRQVYKEIFVWAPQDSFSA